jgi:predicted Zn finger-like uncharacterized protein
MDVSCPQCRTEYEFEDARIPDDGLTVKCTQCAHVFRMKKKALDLPRPTEESQPGREWRLRQASGTIFNFRRLTTLQKWIVERKVQKEDEISLTGDSWKRLGDIAELASFFQVVDDAIRAEARASAPRPPDATAYIPPPPPPPRQRVDTPPPEAPIKPKMTDTLPGPGFSALPPLPPAAARGPSSMSGPPVPNNETIRGNMFSLPPPANPSAPPLAMAPKRTLSGEVRTAERTSSPKLEKQGGLMKWIAVALMILGIGGGSAYYFIVYQPEQEIAAAERAEAARQAEIEQGSKDALAAQQKAAEAAAKARADAEAAGTPAVVVDAGAPAVVEAPLVDAGAPVAVAPGVVDAGTEPAVAKLPPKPKDFDQLLAEAERLRSRDRSEQALALFAKAAELKPQRVEPHAGGGFALLDLGKVAEAEQAFRGALQVNPRYGPALIGMAESSKGLGKKEQAIEYYEKYLEVLPNGTESKMARGAIERLKGP